jgi:hypothetical protein
MMKHGELFFDCLKMTSMMANDNNHKSYAISCITAANPGMTTTDTGTTTPDIGMTMTDNCITQN